MPLQSSGIISLSDVAGEFGGSTPHSLSEYYGVASGVPGSGTISLSNFYGKGVTNPEPEPEPEPELPFRTTGFGGSPGRIDYSSTPDFGGTSYISSYAMGQTSGATGGIASMGLFTEGIGTLGGVPGLSANGFSRIYLLPGGGQWDPTAYTNAITIGIDGDGWWVYNPVWSRYTPPGSTGFSNNYYLSNASNVARIFGPNASDNDTVASIGYYMAVAMDNGSYGIGVDFHS